MCTMRGELVLEKDDEGGVIEPPSLNKNGRGREDDSSSCEDLLVQKKRWRGP